MKYSNPTYSTALKAICFILLLVSSISGFSQNSDFVRRWRLEIRGAGNSATNALSNVKLKPGYGFESTIAFQFMTNFAVYGGWSWAHFATEQQFEGKKLDIDETGYKLGISFIRPFIASEISYIVRAAGIYNHIETENSDGKTLSDSGHGFGWEAGAGIVFPLGNRFDIIPEIRYHSLTRNVSLGGEAKNADLNYVSAGLALSFKF